MKKRSIIWFTIVYGLLLACFTAYLVCDTFFIEHIEAVIPVPVPVKAESSTETSHQTAASVIPIYDPSESRTADESDEESESVSSVLDFSKMTFYGDYQIIGEYIDDSICVQIRQYREYDSDIYVAEISVADPLQLKTAMAKDAYGKNLHEETSSIAGRVNALLAINGDYYSARDSGFVIRNGVLYRSSVGQSTSGDGLAIMNDGSFRLYAEKNGKAEELLADGAMQAFSFGPSLLSGGEIIIETSTEIKKSNRAAHNPRTAICYLGDCHYAFVVVDGRTDASKGVTLYDLSVFLQKLGCQEAYNLDGGGSSTLYFQGNVVNKPSYTGNVIEERKVSDIVYVEAQ